MIQKGPLPVLGELADLQMDVVDGALDVGVPLVDGADGTLEGSDTRIMRDLQIGEAALSFVIILAESLLPALLKTLIQLGQLIEDEFGVWVHGVMPALESSEVVVRR